MASYGVGNTCFVTPFEGDLVIRVSSRVDAVVAGPNADAVDAGDVADVIEVC